MAETYDNKAITGAELQAFAEEIATEMAGKQEALDMEIDVPNKALKFNNVAFTVTTE